ncbi:MAG: hypothetical protein V9E94_04690 [Microthrixaceae bacterium]
MKKGEKSVIKRWYLKLEPRVRMVWQVRGGENAGNLCLRGNLCHAERLTVRLRGGQGANGQDGGDGETGTAGKDGEAGKKGKAKKQEDDMTILTMRRWAYVNKATSPTMGGKGGCGGYGGLGGEGGCPGVFYINGEKIVPSNNPYSIQIDIPTEIGASGKEGAHGLGGQGGQGGRYACDYGLEYYFLWFFKDPKDFWGELEIKEGRAWWDGGENRSDQGN